MGKVDMTEHTLFEQAGFPVFQNRMYNTRQEAIDCPRGDVHIVQNDATGLVYNAAFDPGMVHYDSTYQNEQGHSTIFDRHMDDVAGLVLETMGNRNLVEVGCGKALFLEKLRKYGAEITGFDPAYEGSDPTIRKTIFDETVSVSGNGLILRHVLEHIQDPVAFLRRLAVANRHAGLIYIEVPCLDWIIDNRAWFDFFYEHVNYFRLNDFARMFGRVLHLGHSFGGQYLSVVADLSTLRMPEASPQDRVRLPDGFLPDLSLTSAGGRVIWGGASKGTIFSLLSQRAGDPVSRVIDINPAKQGKHLPATGLRVEPPDDVLRGLPSGAAIIVMNPNYLNEIRDMGGPDFEYRSVHDL